MKYLKMNLKNEPVRVRDLDEVMEKGSDIKGLEEKLLSMELDSGVIRIDTAILDYTTTQILRKIEYLRSKGFKKIVFKLTSPGGSIHHAMLIYDTIKSLHKQGIKTEAIVEGVAASAASMIVLQAVQKRSITENSKILLHEPRRWSVMEMETNSEMIDNTKEMNLLAEMVYRIMSSRSKKSKSKIENLIERREVWMDAKQAKKWNLIDAII